MRKKIFRTTVSDKNNSLHIGLFIVRVGIGLLLLCHHGIPKLEHALAGNFAFGNPIGIGVTLSFFLALFAEFLCSLFLIFGLLTRLASLALVINMVVASFAIYEPVFSGHSELPALFLLTFLLFLFIGPGKISLDRLIFNK